MTGVQTCALPISDKVTKRDLVINFRKPKLGEITSYILLTGEEDSLTFNQKATLIIKEYLDKKPGATKDRIYDELVSCMVRKGSLQSHQFVELLNKVAVPTNTQNGNNSLERWYLRSTEFETDNAETTKEDQAAASVQIFIEKNLKENPENEGVHYSDIFEHYIIAVKDKPRRELRDWLLDYFYLTDEGTYRKPLTEKEAKLKEQSRARGLSRNIRHIVSMIKNDVPVDERPDNATLVEWILHCRRSGMFYEGGVLYERGGLDLGSLDEVTLVEVEEAYHTINKQR